LSPLLLKADDVTIRAELLSQDSILSLHTGKTLASLEITFRSENETDHELVTNVVSSGALVDLLGSDGTPQKKFKVGKNSHSFQVGVRGNTYNWELIEKEEFNLQSLTLADLVLVPYRYHEEFNAQKELEIEARIELSAEAENKLRSLPLYFSVIRNGINTEPVEMRLGRLNWARLPEGRFRVILRLFDKRGYERGSPPQLFQPELSHMQEMLLVHSETLRALLANLESKGVLTRDEKETITTVSEATLQGRHKEFDEVADIDMYEP